MPFALTSDGVRIHYDVWGEGRPLALIPGIGVGAAAWGPFPKVMGKCFRTVSYDPRGLGRSQLPPGLRMEDAGLRRMAEDLVEVLRDAGIGRAHLLGVSLGGIVAQYAASEFPGLADRLVLVSTASRLDRWTSRLLRIFEILAGKLDPAEYAEVVAPIIASPAFFKSEPAKVADMESKLRFEAGGRAAILAQVRAIRELDSRRPVIRMPTLVIGGETDFLTPRFCVEAVHEGIEGSKLLMLEGGHSCLMERSEEGLPAILAFLRGGDLEGAPADEGIPQDRKAS